MRHRKSFNKLSRRTGHRVAMQKNMVTALFKYERITTTKAKAKAIRKIAEKMLTRVKVDTLHNRRITGRKIKDRSIITKLFTDIGPRIASRNGGYTRILKLGYRKGDAAELVLLELVDRNIEKKQKKEKKQKENKTAAVETSAENKE